MKSISQTVSVRLAPAIKKRLDAIARRDRRSKSSLAAEAITSFVDVDAWQIHVIRRAMKELDEGKGISHERVVKWMLSWGKPGELKKPQ